MAVVCQHELVHGAEAVDHPDGHSSHKDDEQQTVNGARASPHRASKPLQLARRDEAEAKAGGSDHNEVENLSPVESYFVVRLVPCIGTLRDKEQRQFGLKSPQQPKLFHQVLTHNDAAIFQEEDDEARDDHNERPHNLKNGRQIGDKDAEEIEEHPKSAEHKRQPHQYQPLPDNICGYRTPYLCVAVEVPAALESSFSALVSWTAARQGQRVLRPETALTTTHP
jgi:hypothetical protein